MPVSPHAQALQLLEQALQDNTWRASWDTHAQRFSTSFTEAMRGPLRSLGIGTSVAVAYTAARSSVSLAPAAYHETWARATITILIREALRYGQEAEEAVVDELGRLVLELINAADRIGTRLEDNSKSKKADFLAASVHASLARTRDVMLAEGAPKTFTSTYFSSIESRVPWLINRDPQGHNLLRAALLEANVASRQQGDSWGGMPIWTKRHQTRRYIIEIAAAMAEVLPNALTQSAQTGNREGKDACFALVRASSHLCSSLTSIDGWVWEAEHEVAPPSVNPAFSPDHPLYSTTANQPKVPSKMTMPKPPLMATLQNDAVDAAWRTAASQFIKLTREPLVAVLSRHLGPDDESLRKKIADFLSTEVGTALLTSVLSVGLSAMPATGSEAPQRLARELRVKAMTDMGDVVADVLMGPLRQVMALYLQGVPANLPTDTPPELPPASPTHLPTSGSETIGVRRNG